MEEELRESALYRFASSLDPDIEGWFSHAGRLLPETLRINPLRTDCEWTSSIIQEMGGERLPWFDMGFQMPWSRGETPEEHRELYNALHQTGRITRQEAASMLPVILLDPKEGEKVLDMCAAPGSKATQISEMMGDSGVVVANDASPGRLNTLVTNRGRVSLANMVLTRHDGRHMPPVPDPGFDAILVDAPCSGSGTMRKNRHVWWKWNEGSGKSMQRLQIDILSRACRLLRPGGRLVYSTCSIDPVENEAVVSHILTKFEWMSMQETRSEEVLPGLVTRPGFNNWNNENFNWKDKEMSGCLRILPQDNDTGGFFLCILRRDENGITAKAMESRRPIEEMRMLDKPRLDERLPRPAATEDIDGICSSWDIQNKERWSWWGRGKKVSLASPDVRSWLWGEARTVKRQNLLPGGHWNPLSVIHAGTTAFQSGKSGMRPRSEAIPMLERSLMATIDVEESLLKALLSGDEPEADPVLKDGKRGYLILKSATIPMLPVWAGTRLSLMIGKDEITILRKKLGMAPQGST